jgi:Spy/CpxP family protein refolding chaperone
MVRHFRVAVLVLGLGWASAGKAWGEGIWPTDRMLEYWLERMALSLKTQYDLDDNQVAQLKGLMTDRWKAFFKDHRTELEPLVTEFVEAQLRPEAPDPAQVQAWAAGAVEAIASIRSEIAQGQGEIRQILRPKQKMKFDADTVKLAVGAEVIQSRLQRWADGEIEEGAMWQIGRQMNREQRMGEPRETAPSERPPEAEGRHKERSTSRPATDKWEEYVERFIRKNQLNESQATTARSILNELRDRAEAHRKRTADETARLERRLAELQAPLDEFFNELTERLEGLVERNRQAGEPKKKQDRR